MILQVSALSEQKVQDSYTASTDQQFPELDASRSEDKIANGLEESLQMPSTISLENQLEPSKMSTGLSSYADLSDSYLSSDNVDASQEAGSWFFSKFLIIIIFEFKILKFKILCPIIC